MRFCIILNTSVQHSFTQGMMRRITCEQQRRYNKNEEVEGIHGLSERLPLCIQLRTRGAKLATEQEIYKNATLSFENEINGVSQMYKKAVILCESHALLYNTYLVVTPSNMPVSMQKGQIHVALTPSCNDWLSNFL